MIRDIYLKRYGKSLIAVLLVFAFLYWGNAFNQVKNWHTYHDYLYSEEFEVDYKNEPNSYIKDYVDNSEIPIYYDSIDEYRNEELIYYGLSQLAYESTIREYLDDDFVINDFESTINQANNYQRGASYYIKRGWTDAFSQLILIVAIGFLLFFVDQKTNFNRFLFSLPVKRRSLFLGKIFYLVLPLLIGLGIILLGNSLIIQLGIPAQYLNATLPQLLYSALSHFALMTLLLTIGIFFGTLLGNLVLAPLALVGGSFSLLVTSYEFYYEFNILVTYFLPNTHLQTYDTLFIMNMGKSGTTIPVLVLTFLASFIFLFLAEKIYQKTFMENDGDFVTAPELRLPTFLTLFIGFNLFFTIASVSWMWILPLQHKELIDANYITDCWTYLLIQFILVFLVSFGLVYFQSIQKWWIKHRDNRLKRKAI